MVKRQRKNLRPYFDVREAIKQFASLNKYFHAIFLGKMGQSYDILKKDRKEEFGMAAKEAQDYGIIHHIMRDLQIQSLLYTVFLLKERDAGWR